MGAGLAIGAAAAGVCLASGFEIYNAYQDIKMDKKRLKEHAITQEEFEISKEGRIRNCVVTCAANAGITMAASSAGLLLAFIPVGKCNIATILLEFVSPHNLQDKIIEVSTRC